MPQDIFDSIALFRLPNQSQAQVIQGNCTPQLQTIDSLTDQTAFVISPFNHQNKTFAIPAANLEVYQGQKLSFAFHFSNKTYNHQTKAHYLNIVSKAVDEMNVEGNMKKVVLSRNKVVDISMLEPIALFEQLTTAYPAAFVYLVSSPQTGTWIGATPELLFAANSHQWKTVALAGTLPNNPNYNWSSKETDEQHLVERYIETILNEQGLAFTKKGPTNIITGDLKHLVTNYNVTPPTQHLRESISKLIATLNPTSAVCGMSKVSALEFIAANENYNRNFYSGFVGLLEPHTQNLFVNLRCLEWQNKIATLFAGAGITANSKPDNEWLETERKMQALLQFIS